MRPIFLAVLLPVLVAAPKICIPQPEDTVRPKVGLVLSGGGARGAAHVGVIKVLDELRIPVDYIAGTSMGALVGGLYASGISASELERIIVEADWQNWLSDRPPRAQRSYRRKADDLGFLVDFDVGINKDGLLFPLGIVQGQNLGLALRRFLLPVATIENFDLLPIPFRAIATNIVSGEEVILDSGDLSTAMRASASTPGMFKPVSINGQVLVDGGVSNNLPVGIAKTMGADVLIVVDVGFPLDDESELNSPLDITSQMLTIFLRARAAEQLQLMTPQDVLITPELDDIGSQSFEQSPEAMRLGEVAARQAISELTTFSLSEAEYALYRQSLRPDYVAAPMVDRVTIENESRLAPEVLEARLSEYRGTALDIDQLEADIADIYGFDTFETVDYSIVADESGNELLLQSTVRSWGPNYLRFGFNLEDDFDGTSNYNLAARLTKTEINSKGGEFRADVVVGENPQLAAEFYQPLDYASRWFINPALGIQRQNDGLFTGGRQIARLRSRESELSFGVGRLFSNWGELRLTLGRSFSGEDVVIGDPSLGSPSSDSTSVSLQFGYDTIDRLAVPRFGTNLNIGWVGVREGFGSKVTADITQLLFLKPLTWGKNTLFNWWEISSVNTSGDTPLNALELGGLFNLTGYASGELQGQHLAMGRLLYYRRLGDRSVPILNTSVYVGASLEVGNVWQDRNEISASNTLSAGSVFVVLDTVIGPLYLAYGAAEGGRRSAYLFLGQTF